MRESIRITHKAVRCCCFSSLSCLCGAILDADGAENIPNSIAISNDGTSIHVSYNDRNHIEQYDISSGKKIKSIKVGKKAVSKIIMHPQLNVIAACRSVMDSFPVQYATSVTIVVTTTAHLVAIYTLQLINH